MTINLEDAKNHRQRGCMRVRTTSYGNNITYTSKSAAISQGPITNDMSM